MKAQLAIFQKVEEFECHSKQKYRQKYLIQTSFGPPIQLLMSYILMKFLTIKHLQHFSQRWSAGSNNFLQCDRAELLE